MEEILKDLQEKEESIYNIRIDIMNSKNDIFNMNNSNFSKNEFKIAKFCKLNKQKQFTTYHHNNLTLYIENDINYVYETEIKQYYKINNKEIYNQMIYEEIIKNKIKNQFTYNKNI